MYFAMTFPFAIDFASDKDLFARLYTRLLSHPLAHIQHDMSGSPGEAMYELYLGFALLLVLSEDTRLLAVLASLPHENTASALAILNTRNKRVRWFALNNLSLKSIVDTGSGQCPTRFDWRNDCSPLPALQAHTLQYSCERQAP